MTPSAELLTAMRVVHARLWPWGPFVSVMIAQWAVESGWGRFESGENNYFNLKATKAQVAAGRATERETTEYYNGVRQRVPQWFANYDTLEEGLEAYATLLVTPHYRRCQEARTPEAYCDALQACGYATAPTYAATLKGIIKSQGLRKYDETVAKVPGMGATTGAQGMFTGFKTFFAGLVLAAGPQLITYFTNFDFTHTFGLSPTAGTVIGAAMMVLRAMTSTPLFTKSQ